MIPSDEQSNSHEILADIMTVVVMIFLIFVLLLALTAGSKIAIESNENAFTGGNQRPTLFLMGSRYTNNKEQTRAIVTTMALDSFIGGQSKNFVDTQLPEPEGILVFIDPGEAVYRDKAYSAIQIANKNPNIDRNIVVKEGGESYNATTDYAFLWDLITSVWGHSQEYFSRTIPQSSRITRRAAVYYESISQDPKRIVVGHHTIYIDDDLFFRFFFCFSSESCHIDGRFYLPRRVFCK